RYEAAGPSPPDWQNRRQVVASINSAASRRRCPASRRSAFRWPTTRGAEGAAWRPARVRARRDQDQTFEISRVRLRETAKKLQNQIGNNFRHGTSQRHSFGKRLTIISS